MIHSQLPIYHTVTDLQSAIMGALAHLNRDVKPWLARMLADEAIWMSVQVRRANIARDAAKVPEIEALLEQLEIVQTTLRHARARIANAARRRGHAVNRQLTKVYA